MQVCRIGDPVAISNSAYAASEHQLSCVESPFGFAMVAYKTDRRDLRMLHFYIGGKPADEHVDVALREAAFETSAQQLL
jgi:hypothetical protein